MKLETKISQLMNEANATNDSRFDVIALELWGNSMDGYDCNNAWYLTRDADISSVIESARDRWEVFKANYHSRGRVSDIVDTGDDENISLEVDCIPFLEIRPSRK